MSKKLLYTALTAGVMNLLCNDSASAFFDKSKWLFGGPAMCYELSKACAQAKPKSEGGTGACEAFLDKNLRFKNEDGEIESGGGAENQAYEHCKVLRAADVRVLNGGTLEGKHSEDNIRTDVRWCRSTCNDILKNNRHCRSACID